MKTLIFFSIFISTNLVAQNVINPYENYDGDEIPNYIIPSSNYTHSINIANGSFGYNGEYLADFGELWWFTEPDFTYQAKSVKLEMIGFPFLMNCIYSSTTSCGDGSTTTRILEMPNYSVVNEQWGSNVWRSKYFDLQITGSYGTSTRGNLVTNGFNQNNPPSQSVVASPWPFFPHTSHKFTLYYHCGSTIFDDIVDSLVFIYDHTRGRMRDYPFMSENSHGFATSEAWDVRFFARLVYKDFGIGHSNQENTNEDIYIKGKTLNYFKIPANPNICTNFFDPTFYFYLNPNEFLNIHPAPYVLPTFQLYSHFSKNTLAGYDLDFGQNPPVYILDQGIRHTYTIQNNYDITEINPVEKIINNPAEVDIESIDLYFPSGYTFKTVRGVYPVLEDVALSIGVEGNYHDLRDVPVYTDLTDIDYGFTNDNPTRSSRYYIKSNSKLTIEPCVTIYDAVFIIQGNGELVFQDRESTYGRFEVFQEDQQGTQTFTDQHGNTSNYTLIDKQGFVERPQSLVPQGHTFLYESNNVIESGIQQIPASLNLPNVIAPETHVVFVAENEVKLSVGFHAAADHSPSGESVFHALIWPSHCAGSGNRVMASNSGSQQNYQPQKYWYPTNPVLQPNPSTNNSRLHFSVLEDSKVSVKLYNSLGELVKSPLTENFKEKGNHIVEIKTEGLQPGIYLCTLYTEVNGSKMPMQVSRKLVVE